MADGTKFTAAVAVEEGDGAANSKPWGQTMDDAWTQVGALNTEVAGKAATVHGHTLGAGAVAESNLAAAVVAQIGGRVTSPDGLKTGTYGVDNAGNPTFTAAN